MPRHLLLCLLLLTGPALAGEDFADPDVTVDKVASDDALIAALKGKAGTVVLVRNASGITKRGLAAIAARPGLRSVRLRLISDLDDDALAGLAGARTLREVVIGGCPAVTGQGLAHLKATKIRRLVLLGNAGLTDAGMDGLTALAGTLEYLDISTSPGLTDAGMRAVAKLERLRVLYLGNLPRTTGAWLDAVGDLQLRELAMMRKVAYSAAQLRSLQTMSRIEEGRRLPSLRTLWLRDTLRGEAEDLVKVLRGCKGLERINIPTTALGRALRKALPDIQFD